jgi:hypothetical protein
MAFIVATRPGRYEVRESRNTPEGPRSRTLAGFVELTEETIEKARSRAAKPVSGEELRSAARRAGAPVATPTIERAARELIAELGKGRRLDPTLRHLLLDLLSDNGGQRSGTPPVGDSARSVAAWMAATPEQRGRALTDLLLLADALPSNGRRGEPLKFPRLDSAGS